MIAYLDGKLVYKDPAYVILDVGGVGYQIKISLNTYTALQNTEERCKLFTYLHIAEDAHTLFGFAGQEEKNLFAHLISVSGIGPGTALVALSSMTAVELQDAIASEDVATIQRIKGIGSKTAQRMVLELKDKVKKTGVVSEPQPITASAKAYNNNRNEALSALITLGIAKPMAEKMLDTVIKHDGNQLTVEQLIKRALKTA